MKNLPNTARLPLLVATNKTIETREVLFAAQCPAGVFHRRERLKFNSRDWDVMHWVIEGVQTFTLRDSAYIVHGGIVGPHTSRLIEMDGSGVVASDLYTKNAGYNYLVFRF